MKKAISCFMTCFLLVFCFSSCGATSNHMTTGYLQTAEKDNSLYIKSRFSNIYKIDLQNRSFSLVENSKEADFEWKIGNEFKYEFFAGEYKTTVPAGYESIIKHIEDCKLDSEKSVVDACGYLDNKILKGFVQVYKDTDGVYGHYAIEKISHSLVFWYDSESDEFSVARKFDNVVIVAVQNDTVIYWKDKAYYSYDMKIQAETYLVEDKAYDSGLNQLSTPAVFANEEMCVLHLVKGKATENIEYMYVFDFLSEEFFELTYLKQT